MTTENIIDFLRTGQLNSFKFGCTPQTLINTLGETSWTIPLDDNDNRPALIKYDQVEFYFDDNKTQKLCGIQITYSQPGDRKNLSVEYGRLKQKVNYTDLKSYLQDQNISFTEKLSEYDKTDSVIETQGHVIFHFDNENNIQKFGRFLKTN